MWEGMYVLHPEPRLCPAWPPSRMADPAGLPTAVLGSTWRPLHPPPTSHSWGAQPGLGSKLGTEEEWKVTMEWKVKVKDTQSCPTVCDPMNRSTPGLPVHHHLGAVWRGLAPPPPTHMGCYLFLILAKLSGQGRIIQLTTSCSNVLIFYCEIEFLPTPGSSNLSQASL